MAAALPLKYPCRMCNNATKKTVLDLYKGLCYNCKIVAYRKTPEERNTFLKLAHMQMISFDFPLPEEFLKEYFNDEEVFDEFLEGELTTDELQDIKSTLAERFTDELYCRRIARDINDDALNIYNSLEKAFIEWKVDFQPQIRQKSSEMETV